MLSANSCGGDLTATAKHQAQDGGKHHDKTVRRGISEVRAQGRRRQQRSHAYLLWWPPILDDDAIVRHRCQFGNATTRPQGPGPSVR